jgi:uncharacterized membrane protein
MQKNQLLRSLVTVALFTVLAAALGLVKIPSPVGSIALDSAPGYFAAAYFHPIIGGLVGAFGHLASASTGGFPLGPLHVFIAVQMFVWSSLFGLIARTGRGVWPQVAAGLVAISLNGWVGPFLLIYSPVGPISKELFYVLLPFLIAASAVNVVLAAIAYRLLLRAPIEQMS